MANRRLIEACHRALAMAALVLGLGLSAPPLLADTKTELKGAKEAPKAEDKAKDEDPDKPINDRDADVGDVATTPLSDLNLKKGEIPPLLLSAQQKPYDLTGLRRCGQIAAAVGELDAILGEDIDVADDGKGGIKAGKLAQSVIGAFIPFRGVIREISGANAQDRKMQAAIYAGVARRAFLKGVGQQRGCLYPARAATAKDIAARAAMLEAAKASNNDGKDANASAAPPATTKPAAPPARKRRR